jgi:hypothetical protein
MATEHDFITPAGLTVTETANVVGNTTSVDMFSNTQRSTTLPSFSQNFKASQTIDPRFTFTRASTATYVAANGVIAYANVNVPRFDYHPTTGACMGLLMEEARTNYFYPSTPTPGLWGAYNSVGSGVAFLNYTITQGGIAPDGSNTAAFMYRTTTIDNNDTFYPPNSLSIANNISYTQSIFVKANTASQEFVFYLGHYNGVEGNENLQVRWYPGNNAIIGGVSGNVYFVAAPAIQNYSNGWKRLYFTFRYTAASPGFIQHKHRFEGNTNVTPATIGANGSGIYLWGAQLENSNFPTTVIPTTTGVVTRNVEYMYTDNTSDIISSDAMTIVCKTASLAYSGNAALTSDTRYNIVWGLQSPSTANGVMDYAWLRRLTNDITPYTDTYYIQYTSVATGSINVTYNYNGFNVTVPTGAPNQYMSNAAYYTAVSVICSNTYTLFAGGNSSVQSSITTQSLVNSRPLTDKMTRFFIAGNPISGGNMNGYLGSLAIYRRVFSNTEIINTISNS